MEGFGEGEGVGVASVETGNVDGLVHGVGVVGWGRVEGGGVVEGEGWGKGEGVVHGVSRAGVVEDMGVLGCVGVCSRLVVVHAGEGKGLVVVVVGAGLVVVEDLVVGLRVGRGVAEVQAGDVHVVGDVIGAGVLVAMDVVHETGERSGVVIVGLLMLVVPSFLPWASAGDSKGSEGEQGKGDGGGVLHDEGWPWRDCFAVCFRSSGLFSACSPKRKGFGRLMICATGERFGGIAMKIYSRLIPSRRLLEEPGDSYAGS